VIKAPIKLQDLRRRLYVKAKAEPTWRFWGVYVHVCKRETLSSALSMVLRLHTNCRLAPRIDTRPPQPVYNPSIALLPPPLQQLPHPPRAQSQLQRSFPLAPMPSLDPCQHHQPIPIPLAHPQFLVSHPTSFYHLHRIFLLCSYRNFSLCSDSPS
jgi:hypothetical protein